MYFVQPLRLNFRGCVFFVDRVLIIIIFSSFGLGNAGDCYVSIRLCCDRH